MKVLAFGEILWDVIDGEEFLGGAPLNFAAHCAQCGNEAYIISRVGKDRLGEKALELCRSFNVSDAYIQIDPRRPTGTVDVVLADGQPDYTIHENVAYDYIAADDIPDVRGFDVLYFGSLAQRSLKSALALDSVLERGKFRYVFYDVNIRKRIDAAAILRRSLPRCTIVKMNTDEIGVVGALLEENSDSYEVVCRLLVEQYPNIDVVIVTAADAGCYVFHADQLYHVPGIPVVVEDAIGAGDAFSAAFMNEFVRSGDPQAAARLANRVGAFVASKRGPLPTYTDEVLKAVRK
ncbi:MAG TPA: carbohydrate kinase [Cyclobacteriaceae bacterium]|nr:carbohydrate kinase [Cyclobacteriaceae bacterium]